jgi:hypothetical protein
MSWARSALPHAPVGQIIPFVRWQHYRGGWKAAINAPAYSKPTRPNSASNGYR